MTEIHHRDVLTELLISERLNLSVPVSLQLLQLNNESKTECCRNAPVSMLFGNAILSRALFTLPNLPGLLNVIHALSSSRPGEVSSLRNLTNQLLDIVPSAGQCFTGYDIQQDAHEYLVYLLNGIELAIPSMIRGPFVSMYKVQTEITLHCTAGHSKSRIEDDIVLSVPIQHPHTEENFQTLNQCLISYFSNELVDLDCQLDCDSHQAMMSRRMIADPDVLLIHLLRFNRDHQKLDHKIQFELKLLGKCDNTPYVLTGIVLHSGMTLQSGHYCTVIYCHQTDRLFLLDDAKKPVPLPMTDTIMQSIYKNAYILLFSKEDKTKQHVSLMTDLGNKLMTEMGIDESMISVPVHCNSSLESETWLGQPIQNDPAEINVEEESLSCCEQSDLQEAIIQSLQNIQLPGVNSQSTTKRKSQEMTPDSPIPRMHVPPFKKNLQTKHSYSHHHQPCPPPVQPAT